MYEKKTVNEWLNLVDYDFIGYMPSKYALMFVNFIKEINGGSEENETPLFHLVMMDRVFNEEPRCAIMVFRGAGKSTIFGEYLILFIAAFGYLPGFGKVNVMMYVSDSIENGVKNLRRNIEVRYDNSDFLKRLIPDRKIGVGTNDRGYIGLDEYENDKSGRKFTDIRLEFINNRGNHLVVRGFGASPLALDTVLYTDTGYTSIEGVKIGDYIYGADGKLAKVKVKSEVFKKPVYRITLQDGRFLDVSEDHINNVLINKTPHKGHNPVEYNLTTLELLKQPLVSYKNGALDKKENIVWIKNPKPIDYSYKDLPLDPYTLGLLLGDGQIKADGSTKITCNKDDMKVFIANIPYELGSYYKDKRREYIITQSIKGISEKIKSLKLSGVNCYNKFIPECYFFGSIQQRKDLLSGLLDTDGCIYKTGRIIYISASKQLILDIGKLIRSLGGSCFFKEFYINKNICYKIEIWLEMYDLCRLERKRKNLQVNKTKKKWLNKCHKVSIEKIERIDDVLTQCIGIDNSDNLFIAGDYIVTHNTGVRGVKELGSRPQVAILDDMLSDEDAKSPTIIENIENTVYKAVSKALHPKHQKIIWLGTPFNANDPLYKAVESGAWNVSVFPVCEKFPVSKEEFKGAWEDRFNYEHIKREYTEAVLVGRPDNFNQELMLRINSDEDRLVVDSDIVYFDRSEVLNKKFNYNFYITTDFATSEKKSADYSVISVWAISNNGDYMLVDGFCKQCDTNEFIDEIFRLSSMYLPLGVGIEISGQQKAIVSWLRSEQVKRNIYFNFLSSNNEGNDGIRPVGDKFSRFMLFLPRIKKKKLWIARDMLDSSWGREFLDEIDKASSKGFKSRHDDILDSISMLGSFECYTPSSQSYVKELEDFDDEYNDISNTIF